MRYATIQRRQCACGVEFETSHGGKMKCRPSCGRTSQKKNAARTNTRANAMPRFVGVDGEGVTTETGEHKYVLLSVGERSYHRDGAHLSAQEIFSFLWECFLEDQDAVYIGYYLGYDFTQWLRTMPQSRAEILFAPERRKRTNSGANPTPFPVYWDQWEFDLLGMKRFKLRRVNDYGKPFPWMHINDVGGFFQQPFATAMLGWQDKAGNAIDIVHPDEREIIERGKARRATATFDKEMIAYNVAENRVLARMLGVLSEGFTQMGVKLLRDQWYGPGQVAQKWMDQHSTHAAKALTDKSENDALFKEALNAARQAYYGGWFETFAHGHIPGKTYEYDINSAYPDVHSKLPCLLHGSWEKSASDLEGDWVLIRADVQGENTHIGAMLHRDEKGRINRPDYTSGWYWRHEVEMARRAGLVSTVTVHEALKYHPCKCLPPMRDLREQYKMRLEVGKNTPHGKSLKLNYNSCYGKTAQSIGTPKHANPIHASLITAGCRTKILEAIATHTKGSESVLMIATDGIYFNTPHPGLQNQPPELGNWEETIRENLTIFLPGVYWDDKARAGRKNNVAKLKSRGVSGADLITRLDELDAQFTRMLQEPIPWTICEGVVSETWWASMRLPIRFSMVSPKQALQRGKWETAGAVTQNSERELWSHPRHKREFVFAPTADKPYITTSRPLNRGKKPSTPYNRSFGMALEIRSLGDEILTPEGDAIDEAYALIQGRD